jgi:hypothetical protein
MARRADLSAAAVVLPSIDLVIAETYRSASRESARGQQAANMHALHDREASRDLWITVQEWLGPTPAGSLCRLSRSERRISGRLPLHLSG